MEITWTVMTTKGPAVGSASVDTRADAVKALTDAWREAVGGAWRDEHETALRSLCREIETTTLPFRYRVPAVAITLDA